jgi:hypothetical protein
MMMTDKQKAILHYGRALVRKRRTVDKKGTAIALIFLVVISLWAGWRRDQTMEQVLVWYEQPDLSGQITIRPAGIYGLGVESDQPLQSSAGLTGAGALHDPRQGR